MLGRVRQTIQALLAWVRPVDNALAGDYLSTELYALFKRMARSDRQHHLRVLARLLDAGHDHPALLTAALLHDVGKIRVRFTIPDRIIAVLVKRFLPHRFETWSQREPRGWRKAIVVSAQHPEWGAEMVAKSGGDALTVALIRYHQTPVTDTMDETLRDLLPHLQTADDAS